MSLRHEFLNRLPYTQMMGLMEADRFDGWPMYSHMISEFNLWPHIGKEIGIAARDTLYDMYYLFLK